MNYYTEYPMTGSLANFMYRVYGWMAAGLACTGATAYFIFKTPALFAQIFRNPILFFGLIIAQFAAVIALAGFVMRMSYMTAVLTFIGYSILTGITLSSIFYMYTAASIYLAFGITAGTFAAMALYGYFTKDDLTGVGSMARMALFGIIIALLINLFLKSAAMDYVISLIGVGVFTLLTAYDSQKIKQMGYALLGHGEVINKVALVAALTLYLDFLNLFLFLLQLLGKRRGD